MNALARGTSAALHALVGAAICLSAGCGAAEEPDTPAADLRMSGFGTLGVVHLDEPAGWGFRRDVGQPADSAHTRADIDSRLGLQLNYAPTPQVEMVGQVLFTHRSPYAVAADSLEWAFVALRPRPDTTLRIGRLDLDQFLLSDYRNVGFAYPMVRPPVEFYGSLPTNLDGVDATRVWNLPDARWQLKAFAGRDHGGDLAHGGAAQFRPLYGLVFSRETDGLLLRLGLSHAGLATVAPTALPLIDGLNTVTDLPVAAVASEARALRTRLDYAGSHVAYATLGLDYDRQGWLATAEFAHVTGHAAVRFDAGHFMIGRRVDAVTVFAGSSGIRSRVSGVATPDWAAALTPVLGAAGAQQTQTLGVAAARTVDMGPARQRTLSLGIRWEPGPRTAVTAQWDRVHISTDGGRLWSDATGNAGRAEVTSVVLGFLF